MQNLHQEFVHVVGQIQNIIAFVADGFRLRQQRKFLRALAGSVVNVFLAFGHRVAVFFQRAKLRVARAGEQQQILKFVAFGAEGAVKREFKLKPEGFPEPLVGFAFFFEHFFQLFFNLLFERVGNHFQLAILLEHFTGNVQRKVFGIHNTFYKAEAVRQQVGALIHNFDAAGIQREPFFKVLGIIVVIRFFGDKQKRLIAGCTLRFLVNNAQGLVISGECFLIKFFVFLFRNIFFVFLPQRNHAVDGHVFRIGFVFAVAALFKPRTLHIHTNREADIVGIFFNQRRDGISIEETVIVRFFGAFFNVQGDFRADGVFFGFGHGVAVRTG